MNPSYNSYKTLVRNFKWSSIFVSNLKRAVAIIAIPLIIITLIATVFYYKTVSAESRISSNQVFSTTANMVENIYDEAETVFCILAAEYGLDVFMSTDSIPDLEPIKQRYIKQMVSMAETHCILSDSIDSISIYSYKANYVLGTHGSGNISNFSDTPWANASSDLLCFSLPKSTSFSICYNVVSSTEKLGLIIFNINPNKVKTLLIDTAAKQYTIQLFDNKQQLFYSSAESAHSSPDFSKNDKLLLTNNYAEMTTKIYDIYLYTVIEHSRPIYQIFTLVSVLFILSILILSLILAFALSVSSYKTINDIVMNVNDIGIGEYYEDSVNEIMYINQNILNMKNKNRMLEQELVKSFASLKKFQTQVLQVQFTPHFLFNALNTLNMSLMLKHGVDNPESDSIIILSDLLSASIDIQHYMVKVGQELEYCKKYVKIQSLISNHNFDVYWDIDEDVKEYITIKFILQPLIENAFKHGIKYLKNKSRGLLNISAKKINQSLVFKITNNGPAPDEDSLNKLNAMLTAAVSSDENHVGLFNVNKRIKLIFGDDYGCKLYIKNELTVVKIVTPIITDFDITES